MPPTATTEEAAFVAPWNVPLPDRVRTLARDEASVAYFYEQPDDSTFRYRIYNMTQVLASRKVPSRRRTSFSRTSIACGRSPSLPTCSSSAGPATTNA